MGECSKFPLEITQFLLGDSFVSLVTANGRDDPDTDHLQFPFRQTRKGRETVNVPKLFQ